MKYLALIQARCGSSRLPNKILMDLCGKPALLQEVNRVKQSKLLDEVMIVTSIEKINLPILKLCAENEIRVFAGSEDDVLDRYYQAAKLLQPEYVVRITGDCPCFDSALLDEAIEEMRPDADYLGMISDTFADGLDIEVFKFSALKKAWQNAKLSSEREHVTSFIRNNVNLFKLQDFVSKVGDFGSCRWTLDEKEDYELINKIYKHFYSINNKNFTYIDILEYVKQNPEISKINAKYARNEGMKKSLENDHEVIIDKEV